MVPQANFPTESLGHRVTIHLLGEPHGEDHHRCYDLLRQRRVVPRQGRHILAGFAIGGDHYNILRRSDCTSECLSSNDPFSPNLRLSIY